MAAKLSIRSSLTSKCHQAIIHRPPHTNPHHRLGLHRLLSTTSPKHDIPRTVFTKYTDPSLYNPAFIPRPIPIPDAPAKLHLTSTVPTHIRAPSVPVTLYTFPSFTPVSLLNYPSTHLKLPLRRDILHRAVIFEGDASRRGTANTKWRSEVHGTGRKIRPQKGTGRARLGNKKSPMLKGGGVAHGPKPRDFSTKLPRKLYDLAWRVALSYRYRRGELMVVDTLWGENVAKMINTDFMNSMTKVEGMDGVVQDTRDAKIAGLTDIFRSLEGQDEMEDGTIRVKRALWIMSLEEDHPDLVQIRRAMAFYHPNDRIKTTKTVDVKNLLELERIVIERTALDAILAKHQSDLKPGVDILVAKQTFEQDTEAMRQAVEQLKMEARGEAMAFAVSNAIEAAEADTNLALKRAQKQVDFFLKRDKAKELKEAAKEEEEEQKG